MKNCPTVSSGPHSQRGCGHHFSRSSCRVKFCHQNRQPGTLESVRNFASLPAKMIAQMSWLTQRDRGGLISGFLTQIGIRMCSKVPIAWVLRPKSLSFGGKFGVLGKLYRFLLKIKVPRHWVLNRKCWVFSRNWAWVLYFLSFLQLEFLQFC